MSFNMLHLSKFRECYAAPPTVVDGNEGKSPKSWYQAAIQARPDIAPDALPDRVTRVDLLRMAADPTIEILPLCISILAWGGMHNANRDHLFGSDTSAWLAVAERIRNGDTNRENAFESFIDLSRRKKLVGMKPAYFTKLIYFLMPRGAEAKGLPGYIMDQWLGCSINLLADKEIVRMNHTLSWQATSKNLAQLTPPQRSVVSTVSEWNDAADYEAFCRAVEALSHQMGSSWTPEKTESALLSKGGHKPHPWRTYVVAERRKKFV